MPQDLAPGVALHLVRICGTLRCVADPVQRRGEWWQEQPDGRWLKWDEASGQWQPQDFPPPPPESPAAGPMQASAPQGSDHIGPSEAGASSTAGPAPSAGASASAETPAPTPGYKYARAEDGTWWARNERTGELHWHDASAGVWRKYVGSTPGAAQAPAAPSADHAGFWQRFGAFLIDAIVVITVAAAVGGVVGLVAAGLGAEASTFDEDAGAGLVLQLFGFVGQWLYFALMESSSKQATLGKMALGLRVTDMDGNRIGFGKATGRFFGKLLSGLILGIGYLMVAWTKKKQGLHDQMAGTLVLRGRA